MSTFPEILAGFDAVTAILTGKPVKVEHAGQHRERFPLDPMGLVASLPLAYTVQVMVLREGANLIRNSRFGLIDDTRLVEWPVDTSAADFREKLAEVLVPAVDDFLGAAAADKARMTTENPDGPHEARDAVERIF